jgi:hypothetical protein
MVPTSARADWSLIALPNDKAEKIILESKFHLNALYLLAVVMVVGLILSSSQFPRIYAHLYRFLNSDFVVLQHLQLHRFSQQNCR